MSRDLVENPFYGVLKEYQHWIVLFRSKQVTIGSVIVMSKHTAAQSLGALSSEAWSQFGEVCKDVETAITGAFGAEKFNYLALMMDDPEVHFHVIPRYSKPVEFAGGVFVDPDWPKATQRIGLTLSDEVKQLIEQALLKGMNIQ